MIYLKIANYTCEFCGLIRAAEDIAIIVSDEATLAVIFCSDIPDCGKGADELLRLKEQVLDESGITILNFDDVDHDIEQTEAEVYEASKKFSW